MVRGVVERGFEFRPLPHSREEVNRIAALFPDGRARVFLGKEASEERVEATSGEARILHLATHGRFDERVALNSFLALSQPESFEIGQDNGLLQAWEIFEGFRINADLVVLSACETGLGEELPNEGLNGLTRAFRFAGARSVIATSWQVDDRASAELMVRFYRHLGEGKSKDQALRAAQIELIREPVEVTTRGGRRLVRNLSLPYFWAAFQLTGDWQ